MITPETSTTLLVENIDNFLLNGIAKQRAGIIITQQHRSLLLQLVRSYLSSSECQSTIEQLNREIVIGNFICFVSLINQNKTIACLYKPAEKLANSAILSAKALKEMIEKDNIDISSSHIEINILFHPKIINILPEDNLVNNFRLGIDALGIQHKNKFAVMTNSIPIKYGYDINQLLVKLADKCNIKVTDFSPTETKLIVYNSLEFREDYLSSSQKFGLYDLYRGNPITLQQEVTDNAIKNSAQLTAQLIYQFLTRHKSPLYEYDYLNNQLFFCETPESVLRTLASITTLANYALLKKDSVLLAAAKEKVNYFINKYYVNDTTTGYLKINGIVDIGTTGCLLLAITSIGNLDEPTDIVEKLTAFIINAYDNQNKKFKTILEPLMPDEHHESEYFFPGIALCALLSTNNKQHLSTAINLAESTFPYYEQLFEKTPDGIKMLTWMTAAYSKLYLLTKNDAYKDFIFAMNDIAVQMQLPFDEDQIDLVGSFSKVGNIRATAAILESIIEAKKIAQSCGDKHRAILYGKSVQTGLRFLLQSQYKEDNTFNDKTIGGFKNNFFETKIRIDNLQHVLEIFLKLSKI